MNGSYLLDTNVALLFIDREIDLDKTTRARELYVCPAVVGELYFGAESSARPRENIEKVAALLRRCPSLVCDTATARHYGRIRRQLRERGRPIPQNDVWIAASALQHELTLVTRDAHFGEVEGLEVESW